MNCAEIIRELIKMANPANRAGMARYGITVDAAYGVSVVELRKVARRIGKNHELALELWDTGIHEARMLAGFIDIPKMVNEDQMEQWVIEFDSWDICDQICSNLFSRTPFAVKKAVEWAHRPEEFVKRAGFVLMTSLAVHDKKADDTLFTGFLPVIAEEASDERNFVKKAVNWALRQIGKRNPVLNAAALDTAQELLEIDSKSARWIARDAIRELRSESAQKRLNRNKNRTDRS